jgi:hypothetical protein
LRFRMRGTTHSLPVLVGLILTHNDNLTLGLITVIPNPVSGDSVTESQMGNENRIT